MASAVNGNINSAKRLHCRIDESFEISRILVQTCHLLVQTCHLDAAQFDYEFFTPA